MAHYKRGKSRTKASPRTSRRMREAQEKRLGIDYIWLGSWPRYHDIIYHNRPRRREEKFVAHQIVTDTIDAEEALWPVEKKPHKYYW